MDEGHLIYSITDWFVSFSRGHKPGYTCTDHKPILQTGHTEWRIIDRFGGDLGVLLAVWLRSISLCHTPHVVIHRSDRWDRHQTYIRPTTFEHDIISSPLALFGGDFVSLRDVTESILFSLFLGIPYTQVTDTRPQGDNRPDTKYKILHWTRIGQFLVDVRVTEFICCSLFFGRISRRHTSIALARLTSGQA